MNKHQTIMSELACELSEEITENGWYKFQMYMYKGDSGITHLDGISLVKANPPEDEPMFESMDDVFGGLPPRTDWQELRIAFTIWRCNLKGRIRNWLQQEDK